MAARKLKFKPKPTFGASVRRGREKEDLELQSNELESFKKDCADVNSRPTVSKDNISARSESEVAIQPTKVNICKSNNSDSISFRTNVTHCKNITVENSSVPDNNSVSEQTLELSHEKSNSLVSNTPPSPHNPVPSSELQKSEDVLKIVYKVPVDTTISDSSLKKDNISSTKTDGSELVSESTKDATRTNANPSAICVGKIDTQKLARFGRSRCKPVLNNSLTRKKNEAQQSNIVKNDLIPENVLKKDSCTNKNKVDITDTVVAKSTQSVSIHAGPDNESDSTNPINNSASEILSKDVHIPNIRTDSLKSDVSNPTVSAGLETLNTVVKISNIRTDCVKESNSTNLSTDSNSEVISTDVNICNIRTDSVIKSVKEEINKEKARALVEEIADSFTSLESEETEITQQEKHHTETNTIPSNDSISPHQPGKTYSLLIKPVFLSKMVRFADVNNSVSTNLSPSKKGNKKLNSPTKYGTSPVKTTTKMLVPKPSPRISDLNPRRISFQGSDYEDEPKSKMYNENEIKKLPRKEKNRKDTKNNKRGRSHGSSYSQMGHDAMAKLSKRLQGDKPDKSKLTMIDLIFYNPKTNPMTVNPQPNNTKKKEEKHEINDLIEETLAEQSVDEVESSSMPVPQLKIGPDGQIMLDPKSLVIETTGTEKNRAKLENSEVIQETGPTRYRSYSKRKTTRTEWTAQETLQFYRALNTIGSDFALMTKLFPKRTRHDLKLKFKREEKSNMNLIDKAMTAPVDFDFKTLEEELKKENEEIERRNLELEKQKAAMKEARAKKKEDKSNPNKRKKCKSRAFKDFEENESEVVPVKTQKKYRKRRKAIAKKKDEFVDSESDLDVFYDSDTGSENDSLALIKKVKETASGSTAKRVNKLMEYEEINETLKKKMEEDSEIEDDVYIPNGLFGSPRQTEDKQWDIEIPSLPTIEQTVIMDNIENVSELSELGSFGQNDTALDLSVPVRVNPRRSEDNRNNTMFNGQIISESIQIIDQLTANVECDSMYHSQDGIKTDACETESTVQYEEENNKVVLPSFESVSRIRPPMLYPIPSSYVPDETSRSETFEVRESDQCEPSPQRDHGDSHDTINENTEHCISESCREIETISDHVNQPNIVLSNYYNESDECILGD